MVILDRLQTPYSWLVFDGTEDFIDGELQWGEVLFHSEQLEWIRRENQEYLLLEDGLPLILD